MKLRYFELDSISKSETKIFEAWLSPLESFCKASGITFVITPANRMTEYVARAMWFGDPFVVAGDRASLRKWLNTIDAESACVLKDSAYCWFLTDSHEFAHERLPPAQHVVLNCRTNEQVIVCEGLNRLARFPLLKGLSHSMDRLRREIIRIASGPTGPSYAVLILGPTGAGKELVFQSLVAASSRQNKPMRPISGAWLNMEPGMAMTEVVGLRRGPKDERCDGLLKQFSEGSLFVDDFESAPQYIQETLLRVMNDPVGEYRPVGSATPEHTDVWLLFATNKNLREFLGKGLREDFLYRFETRIIAIPLLRDRPGDFPAIAHAIWSALWRSYEPTGPDHVGTPEEPIRSEALRCLFAKGLEWEGNVRTLRAFLGLVVSMMHDPLYNGYSQGELVELISARGRTLLEWLGIVQEKYLARPMTLIEQIRDADRGHSRQMGPSNQLCDPLESDLTPSETKAREALTDAGWESFRNLCKLAPPTTSSRRVRRSVRLARILWYLSQSASITPEVASQLTGVGDNTAREDLEVLEGGSCPLIRQVSRSKPVAFEPVKTLFEPRP